MEDLISRQAAIKVIKNYCENECDIAEDNWCPDCQYEQFVKLLEELPSAKPRKSYTKADYIMCLHGEYGCSYMKAEKAHEKALEYLRDTSMLKG